MNPDPLIVSLGLALALDRTYSAPGMPQGKIGLGPLGRDDENTVAILQDQAGAFEAIVTGDLVLDEAASDPAPDALFERLQRELEDYIGLRAQGEPVEVVSVPGWLWFSYEQALGQVQAVGQRRAVGRYNKKLRVVFVLSQARHVAVHELVHHVLHDNISPPLPHDLNEGLVEAITMDFLGVETGGYPEQVLALRRACERHSASPRELPGLLMGPDGATWRERLGAGASERVGGWSEALSRAGSYLSFAIPALSFIASGAMRLRAMPESAMFLRVAWLCHLGQIEEARAQALSCLKHLDATFSAMVVASVNSPKGFVEIYPRTYDMVNLALSGEVSGMISDSEPVHVRFYRAATAWALHLSTLGA